MLRTGHHPQDKIYSLWITSCGYILWATHDILWVYPVGYKVHPVGISCGLQSMYCGYILWATKHILWIYPVDNLMVSTGCILWVNTIVVYAHLV